MRKSICLLALTLTLIGCVLPATDVTYWYRPPNTTLDQKSEDIFNCEVKAARAVPTRTQVRTNPTYYSPGYTTCNSYGCTTVGGSVSGGGVYSVDANRSLRHEYISRCIGELGYRWAPVPRCPPASVKVSPELMRVLQGKLRAPDGNVCWISIEGGRGNVLYEGEAMDG